jgi:hypothetical protein
MSATDEKSPGAASPKTLASTATDTVTETPVAAAPAPAAAAAASSTATKQSLWDRLYAKLPPWFTKALYNKRQWKNLVRTLIAFFAMCILMVCNKCK